MSLKLIRIEIVVNIELCGSMCMHYVINKCHILYLGNELAIIT